MLVADFAQALQIALGRHDHAARTLHRLDDDGGDGGRIVQLAQPLQIVGEFDAVLRLAAREDIARIAMGVADVIDAGDQRAEHLAVGDHAADAHAAEIDAVIALLAPDQAHALAFALHAVIGDGHLQRGLDRLRTGVGEEDVVQIARHQRHQPVGQFERLVMADLERRRIVELARLLADRFDDARPVVAGVAAPHRRDAVQHLAPVRGLEIHAVGAGEEARIGLELPVRGERHPIGFEVVLLRFSVHRLGAAQRIERVVGPGDRRQSVRQRLHLDAGLHRADMLAQIAADAFVVDHGEGAVAVRASRRCGSPDAPRPRRRCGSGRTRCTGPGG